MLVSNLILVCLAIVCLEIPMFFITSGNLIKRCYVWLIFALRLLLKERGRKSCEYRTGWLQWNMFKMFLVTYFVDSQQCQYPLPSSRALHHPKTAFTLVIELVWNFVHGNVFIAMHSSKSMNSVYLQRFSVDNYFKCLTLVLK